MKHGCGIIHDGFRAFLIFPRLPEEPLLLYFEVLFLQAPQRKFDSLKTSIDLENVIVARIALNFFVKF